jgi:hypothetical protein
LREFLYRAAQQPLPAAPPNTLVMSAPPSAVGTEAGHGWLLEATGADAAVVFAVCVEALEASPGNCFGVCEWLDAEALMPTVVPDVLSLFAAFGCGTGTVVGTVRDGTFSGSEPQPAPVPPAGWLVDEQGVSLRLVPPDVGWFATVGPVTEAEPPGAVVPAAVPVVVVLGMADVPVWACATPKAASHRIIAEANRRCIASSFSREY